MSIVHIRKPVGTQDDLLPARLSSVHFMDTDTLQFHEATGEDLWMEVKRQKKQTKNMYRLNAYCIKMYSLNAL